MMRIRPPGVLDMSARPLSSSLDHELLSRWRDGDQEAGDVLVQRHFGPIFRFFRVRLDSDAEDLVQQTFLGCLEAADRFLPGRPLRPYLFEIARRQLYKHVEKLNSRRNPSPIGERHVESPDTTPSQLASRNHSGRVLVGALRRLPEELQTVVQLHYWEGLTTGEVGEILEIPAGTVKSRLYRARDLLREEFGGRDLLDAVSSSSSLRGVVLSHM